MTSKQNYSRYIGSKLNGCNLSKINDDHHKKWCIQVLQTLKQKHYVDITLMEKVIVEIEFTVLVVKELKFHQYKLSAVLKTKQPV